MPRINDEIFIPPGCPAILGEWRPIDIASTAMRFASLDHELKNGPAINETYISFNDNPHDDCNQEYIEPRSLLSDPRSEVAKKAHALADRINGGDTDALEQLKNTFCERVANCHGVVDGECWALGPAAMTEVILDFPE